MRFIVGILNPFGDVLGAAAEFTRLLAGCMVENWSHMAFLPDPPCE